MTQDTVNGDNPVFTALEITVICTVTSIQAELDPSAVLLLNYVLLSPNALEINLTDKIVYKQTANCESVVESSTISWIIPNDAISEGIITLDADNDHMIQVKGTESGSYALTMINMMKLENIADAF